MKDQFDISIVVLTFNCEKTIEKCLASLKAQSYSNGKIEIIILDNGSNDRTIEIIEDNHDSYHYATLLSIAALRNKGLALAKAKIVGFVDSDCVIDVNWVNNAITCIKRENATVVGYKYHLPPHTTYFERTWYSLSKKVISNNELIPAGNMIVVKNDIIEINGFNESLPTGEDSDLLHRVRSKGLKVVLDPGIINYHYGNAKTLKEFYIKELWYGMGVDLGQAIKDFDKPLVLSIVFSLNFILLIVSVFLKLYEMTFVLFIISFTICFMSACNRKYYKQRGGNLLYIMMIYVVYFFARFHSLLYILKIKKYRNVKSEF
jgi:glycosyltransferase involved in cell wall biosynthesis